MEKNLLKKILIVACIPNLLLLQAQTPKIKSKPTQYLVAAFIENKGQLPDSILYDCPINGGHIYILNDGYIVNKSLTDGVIKAMLHQSLFEKKIIEDNVFKGHNYSVKFKNHSLLKKIVPQKKIITQYNYLMNYNNKAIQANCAAYSKIIFQNIYPNIDIVFSVHEEKLKYDIIVRIGGKLKDLAFEYDGVKNLKIDKNGINYNTSIDTIQEHIPRSFLENNFNNTKKTDIKIKYTLQKNVIGFEAKFYDTTQVLIIDPVLVFASFSGSKTDNWGFTSTYGADGSFYLGGIVFRPGFNPTIGAYQTNYGGGNIGNSLFYPPHANSTGFYPTDVVITKFNSDGSAVLFATYLGGSGDELPNSMIEDSKGRLIILGRTSSFNFPYTKKFGNLGRYDIFITKLNATGTGIIESWAIGGSSSDGINVSESYSGQSQTQTLRFYSDMTRSEIILDSADNIYVASQTSSSDFPTTNAFQTTLGGAQDAVFIKISENMKTILCSSFLGGSNTDAGVALNLNIKNNDIYITGSTLSDNFPGDKTGTIKTNLEGTADGFIARIKNVNNNFSLLKSTFIGTTNNDYLYGIQSDKYGNVYFTGVTDGNWTVVNSAYDPGYGKNFIAKTDADLSAYIYTTRFGTNNKDPNISPVAFMVDRCENVFVGGFGRTYPETSSNNKFKIAGTSGLYVSPDAIQTNTDGGDFYFVVFEKNATKILYATFYGVISNNTFGDHVDGGTSRFDPDGTIYQGICAACEYNGRYPTTPNAAYRTKGSIEDNSCNMLGVKISFDLSGIASLLQSRFFAVDNPTRVCVNSPVLFYDKIAQGEKYFWLMGDGSPETSTTTPSLLYAYKTEGTYTVRLISYRASACNIRDTSYVSLQVLNNGVKLKLDFQRDTSVCSLLKINFTNLSTSTDNVNIDDSLFEWNFGDGTIERYTKKNFVSHIYAQPGVYTVTLIAFDDFCNRTEQIQKNINVISNAQAQYNFTSSVYCSNQSINVKNVSDAADSYKWYVNGVLYSEIKQPSFLFSDTGIYKVKLVITNSLTCNKRDSLEKLIVVQLPPKSDFVVEFIQEEKRSIPKFFNQSKGASGYEWDMGDSFTIIKKNAPDTPFLFYYKDSKKYNVCLTAFQNGCSNTTCKLIGVAATPIVLAPNAFTPNGDNINDVFFVRVLSATFIQMKIYNRWGQVVFETFDAAQSWDGTYVGKPQEPDLYSYIVDYELGDKTKQYYKGAINLIR